MTRRPGATRRAHVPRPTWRCHVEGCSTRGGPVEADEDQSARQAWEAHYLGSHEPGHYRDRAARGTL